MTRLLSHRVHLLMIASTLMAAASCRHRPDRAATAPAPPADTQPADPLGRFFSRLKAEAEAGIASGDGRRVDLAMSAMAQLRSPKAIAYLALRLDLRYRELEMPDDWTQGEAWREFSPRIFPAEWAIRQCPPELAIPVLLDALSEGGLSERSTSVAVSLIRDWLNLPVHGLRNRFERYSAGLSDERRKRRIRAIIERFFPVHGGIVTQVE